MKISYIQMPNNLILDTNLNTKAKYLYLVLKISSTDNISIIYTKTLLKKLQWSDTKTLKKYLTQLKHQGYIQYDFNKLPKHKPMEIKLLPKGYYTELDREIIHKTIEICKAVKIIRYTKDNNNNNIKKEVLADLKEDAIILLYLYEMYYNENFSCGYACPSYEHIYKTLKIRQQNITAINKTLHDNYICKCISGTYHQDDDGNIRQHNNRYIPNKIVTEDGKTRYKRHKVKNKI